MASKWYTFYRYTIGTALHIINRVEAKGLENVPVSGQAILASNHLSVMDSFYLPLMMKRELVFPAKSEYFTTPGMIGRLQKFFFSSVGQIPVDRNAAGAGDETLKAARSVLDQGEVFGIYPEGTRSPDGRLFRGRTGMARIAMATGAPVVPVAMLGSREANPVGSWILRPVKVRIKLGKAIDPHQWARDNGFDPGSREAIRPFTDHVMQILADLGGQPYVDMYASVVKRALAEGKGYPEDAEPGGALETPGKNVEF